MQDVDPRCCSFSLYIDFCHLLLCYIFPSDSLRIEVININYLYAELHSCSRLQRLDVDRNCLTSLENLDGCLLLMHMNAGCNQVEQFPEDLPAVLLTSLSLEGNRFTAELLQFFS